MLRFVVSLKEYAYRLKDEHGARRHELSNEQWAAIKDLIPGRERILGRRGVTIGCSPTLAVRAQKRRSQGEPLLEGFSRGDAGTIIADAAYDSEAMLQRARQLRAKGYIMRNARRKKK
jgi:transposase